VLILRRIHRFGAKSGPTSLIGARCAHLKRIERSRNTSMILPMSRSVSSPAASRPARVGSPPGKFYTGSCHRFPPGPAWKATD